MNLRYREILPLDFPPDSRVWIYQASRPFTDQQSQDLESLLARFVGQWQSHGTPVKGYGHLFFNQFVLLLADESASGVSGCSTDSSVRLIQELEQKFEVPLFDRQQLAFVINDQIKLIPLAQLELALANRLIATDTLYFNNTVQTKGQWESQWIIPVGESWLARRLDRTLPIA
jgi:hypothetical protein